MGWQDILYGRIYVDFSFLTLHKVCTKARLLGERSVRIREVKGSNPSRSTNLPHRFVRCGVFMSNAGSAYAHYRFSLLCDTNVRQHFYLPITQPASIERCNGDGGEQFARTSVQLKQCFVLSAHPHCSLGLGICIAHWL